MQQRQHRDDRRKMKLLAGAAPFRTGTLARRTLASNTATVRRGSDNDDSSAQDHAAAERASIAIAAAVGNGGVIATQHRQRRRHCSRGAQRAGEQICVSNGGAAMFTAQQSERAPFAIARCEHCQRPVRPSAAHCSM